MASDPDISHPIRSCSYLRVRFLTLCYFIPVALILLRTLHYGFIGDESGYVASNTAELAARPWLPFYFAAVDTGHPMIYIWPVAVMWRLIGPFSALANVTMWLYAGACLAAVHLLMERILAASSAGGRGVKWAGPAAALALLSTPLFISLAGQYLDPVPMTAVLLGMILAWAGRRRWLLAVFATLLALTRLTGCLSVFGMGLFDLAYTWAVLRQRSARALLRALAPYAASAAVFFAFLFIKLVVLDRPLSTIKGHKLAVSGWEMIRMNFIQTIDDTLAVPPYSMKPLLGIAGAAGLLALARRRRAAARSGGDAGRGGAGEGRLPGALGIHAACLASMIVPCLFYIFLYPGFVLPRYLLPFHAFFILMGVQGLLALSVRRAWIVLPLLGLWCALQVTRWHVSWTEWMAGGRQGRVWNEVRLSTPFTMDMIDRKALYVQTVNWLKRHARQPTVLAAYPSKAVFSVPCAGFMKPDELPQMVHLELQRDPEAAFKALVAAAPEIYLIQTFWDHRPHQELQNALLKKHDFARVFNTRSTSGEWIAIYRFRSLRERLPGAQSSRPLQQAGVGGNPGNS